MSDLSGPRKKKNRLPKARPKKYVSRRIQKKVTACEHTNEKYYSRGLCKNCYHKLGRIKMATACEHKDRKLYARNVCKGCYLKIYFRGNKDKNAKAGANLIDDDKN